MPPKTVCHFFNTPAGCKRGVSCTFAHECKAGPPMSNKKGSYPPKAPPGICNFFYATGSCNRGFSCKFKHEVNPSVVATANKEIANITPSPLGLLSLDQSARKVDAMSPSEAHNHLRRFLVEKYRFPSARFVYAFMKVLDSARPTNQSWSMEDGQLFLTNMASGNGVNRINDVLQWPEVSASAGSQPAVLSFQRGIIPLLEFLSCDFVVKSTLSHLVNALYSLITENAEKFSAMIESCMKEVLLAHTFDDPNMPGNAPLGSQVFTVLSAVLFECLTRFKNAVVAYPQLAAIAKSLPSWTEEWCDGISSSKFKDAITGAPPLACEHIIQHIKTNVDRVASIVEREQRRIEQTASKRNTSLVIRGISRNEGLMSMLHTTYEGPGEVRVQGRRHDNDYVYIKDIRIAPTHEELSCSIPPYLPGNVHAAPHHSEPESMERLLDVQFRLLREELTAPLRSSSQLISNDLKDLHRQGNRLAGLLHRGGGKYHGYADTQHSVLFNVYTNVQFLSLETDRRGLCVKMTLDSPPGRARAGSEQARLSFWEGVGGKRLMQSGLVALVWMRQGRVDVHLGTIASSTQDLKDSARRNPDRIAIKTVFFDPNIQLEILEIISSPNKGNSQHRVLIEAPVMFESIRPFLEALKVVPESLPFERYLPHHPPGYLSSIDVTPPRFSRMPNFSYQLSSLFPPEANVDSLRMSVEDPMSVDHARQELKDKSRLDPSQADAVIDTLTRELTLIQGPPGTGKSFTGVELIRVLLANNLGPIIMIAFTNHALDHLLLSVLDSNITHNFVRLGSRSADERISQYSIENLERAANQTGLQNALSHLWRELKSVEEAFQKLMKKFHQQVQPEQLLHYIDIAFPEHYDHFLVPPPWIKAIKDSLVFDDGNGWQTIGQGGRTEVEDDSVYTFWRKSRDLEFLQDAIQESLQPRRASTAGHVVSATTSGPHNRFAALGDIASEASAEDSSTESSDGESEAYSDITDDSEDSGIDEPWQKEWVDTSPIPSALDTSASEPEILLQPADHSAPSPPSSVADFAEDVSWTPEYLSAFFQTHGRDGIPTIPTSDRSIEELLQDNNIWKYSPPERLRLHNHWTEVVRSTSHEVHLAEFSRLREKHETALNNHREGKNEMWRSLLKNVDIIGCTTTGAAKLTALLKSVSPRIMLVEEAGQVMEAHILGSLVPSIQHLILIGDPKQLRPTLNNYSLSMDSRSGHDIYRLDMSMMERLSEGGLHMSVINTQRRMRPEISSLIRNTLYPALEDSDVVKEYSDVKGFVKNVFFLDHDHKECGGVEESSSKYNDYEVSMIKDLVLYLLRQGPYCKEGDIIVLCAYLGQLARVRDALAQQVAVIIDERDQQALADQEGEKDVDDMGCTEEVATTVQVSRKIKLRTIDNFQGEEGKIVILSLVRNSGAVDSSLSKATIGFLKSDNRSNVALSRAREGMFILGNSSQLSSRSRMWRKVLDELRSSGCVGQGFPVCCSQHPDSVAYISQPEQLTRFAPDGGCLRSCDVRLKCGHLCPYKCHPDDKNHIAVRCTQKCNRLCSRQHPCNKSCAQDCGKCSFSVSNVELPCGHMAASVRCFELDNLEEFYCKVPVVKQLPRCEHTAVISCSADPDEHACQIRCGIAMLCCGRDCGSKCHDCQQVNDADLNENTPIHRVQHLPHACATDLYCMHHCQYPCSKEHQHTRFCKENCRQECKHARCKQFCSTPCAPCQEPCTWICPHYSCPLPCGSVCARLPCDRRCERVLGCGHKCPSVCGEDCSIQLCPLCNQERSSDVVDLILGRTLEDIDQEEDALDEIIITLPKCRHAFTVESLDGICEMDEVYHRNSINGTDGPWLSLKPPTPNFKNPPVCPTCRTAITSPRYGRIFKRADLDILERNVASQMSSSLSVIHKTMASWSQTRLQDRLSESIKSIQFAKRSGGDKKQAKQQKKARKAAAQSHRNIPAMPEFLYAAGTLHSIAPTLAAAWTKIVQPLLNSYKNTIDIAQTRSAHNHAWEAAVSSLYKQEMDQAASDPLKASRNPQEHAMCMARLRVGQPQPLADKRFVVEAFWTTMEIRFILSQLGSFVLKRLGHDCPAQEKQLWASYCLFILDSCLIDADIAYDVASSSKSRRQMSKTSLLIMRAYLERFRLVIDGAYESQTMSKSREDYIERALQGQEDAERIAAETVRAHRATIAGDQSWLTEHFSSVATIIINEWKAIVRSLRMETFYEPVSLQERMDVVKALNFSHAGHFYNCPNGHPFVITECGGAMERAVCPECGSAIGGTNHRLDASNTPAVDLESIARQQGAGQNPWFFP